MGRRAARGTTGSATTWVFNAGKQVGPVPPHITLDTDAGTADWFGVFESETISLA